MGEGEAPRALVEHLLTLGLEEKEARLYAGLCLDGPQRASDLAARAGLNRTETYRALESLIERGVVTSQLTRPTVYEAIPPETAFADALRRHEGHRGALERARESALHELARLRERPPPGGTRHGYRMISGRRSILTLVETMLRNMKTGQRLASTYFAPGNATTLSKAMRATVDRAREGVPMKMLLQRHPGIEETLAPFAAFPHIQVRFFDVDAPIRFTIVDEREVLVWLHTDPEPGLGAKGDVAMWTNAPDFVRAQGFLYDALWARGQEATAVHPRA